MSWVEYEHVAHPEWTVQVLWEWRRREAYQYEWWQWRPRAIEWSLWVPEAERLKLEELLRQEHLTESQNAPDLFGSKLRPTTSRLHPRQEPRQPPNLS